MEKDTIKPSDNGDKTERKVERNPDGTLKSGVLNPEGRKGSRNFSTLFEKAIKKIALTQNTEDVEIEVDLVLKAIAEAKKGKFQYHKDIFDRVYGQADENIKQKVDISFDEAFNNDSPSQTERNS